MRKALIILALLALTSCASWTENKVDDCLESTAWAAIACSGETLLGTGDCAEAMAFVGIDCGQVVAEEMTDE